MTSTYAPPQLVNPAPGVPRADGTYPPGRPPVVLYRPGVPSVVQLLNLADRAERQVLSPAEADRLRLGLAWMAAREARVDRLASALEASPGGLMARQTAGFKIRSALTGRRVRRQSVSDAQGVVPPSRALTAPRRPPGRRTPPDRS